MKTNNLTVKRIYEDPAEEDGKRVLVDRLWPRGVSKIKAHLDEWYKDVAPSNELRMWFDHKEEKFKEFRKQYLGELKKNKSDELAELVKMSGSGTVTLLYAAKDEQINHAGVLREFLLSAIKKGK